VSVISCWEVAKLVEIGRLELPVEIETWLAIALNYPGIELLDLMPRIAVEATTLPGNFHCLFTPKLRRNAAPLPFCSK